MPEANEYNREFADAWDELASQLTEPGFSLEEYLGKLSERFAPETIKELRIAAGLADVFQLGVDYDRWRQVEDARESRKGRFLSGFNRLGWAAAAAVLIIGLFLGGPPPTDTITGKPGFGNIHLPFSLVTAVSAAIEEFDIPGTEITISETGGRFTSMDPIRYDDLEGDGETEIIFARDGYVICLDHKGVGKWMFDIDTQKDMLKENFFDELEKSRGFWQKNSDNFIFNEDRRMKIAGMKDIDTAWPVIFGYQAHIVGIVDFNRDGDKDVLVYFPGAIFVLDHATGEPQDVVIDGEPRKFIKLLDGDYFTKPMAIENIQGDDNYEFIIYRGTNCPASVDGELLASRDRGRYVYDGNQPFNNRGLYVASHEGKELWHLNLPYHCGHIEVGDLTGNGQIGIYLDTYLPNNGFEVRYKTRADRETASRNFIWDNWPDDIEELIDPLSWDAPADGKRESAIIIIGVEDGSGTIKHLSKVDGDSKHFYTVGRFVDFGEYESLQVVQYNDVLGEEPYWYRPWYFDGKEFEELEKMENLYPEMRWQEGLFGFDTGDGPRLVFGLSPQGIIRIVDERYTKIRDYRVELEIGSQSVPWKCDAIVYDVEDIDNDGSPEILAGFGALHAPWGYRNADGYQNRDVPVMSVMKILTADLQPYHPELGWDTFEVVGPVIQAGFEKLDSDDGMDIFVISDYVYFLKPEEI